MFDFGAWKGEAVRAGARELPGDGPFKAAADKGRWQEPAQQECEAGYAAAHGALLAAGKKGLGEKLRKQWRTSPEARKIHDAPKEGAIGWLPAGSWVMRFDFRLAKELLTKDDRGHYPIENPVRKDRVFGMPILAATSWKGCLRAAYLAQYGDVEREPEERIFGTRKGEMEDGGGEAGRLILFASEFDKIGFVVISPHERKKKEGKPILYEAAPLGSKGVFQAAYCNWDGRSGLKDAASDLKQVGETIGLAMGVLGIGAKTSSGFGAAKDEIDGEIRLFGMEGEPEELKSLDGLAAAAARAAERIGR